MDISPLSLVFIIAISLTLYGVVNILRYRFSKNWIALPATISHIETEYKYHLLGVVKQICSFPKITYEYRFSGTKHVSNRVSFNKRNVTHCEGNTSPGGTHPYDMFWEHWEQGHEINILVNPKSPSSSVIIGSMSNHFRSHLYSISISGIILIIVWLLLYIIS